jgi:hypothetical protein
VLRRDTAGADLGRRAGDATGDIADGLPDQRYLRCQPEGPGGGVQRVGGLSESVVQLAQRPHPGTDRDRERTEHHDVQNGGHVPPSYGPRGGHEREFGHHRAGSRCGRTGSDEAMLRLQRAVQESGDTCRMMSRYPRERVTTGPPLRLRTLVTQPQGTVAAATVVRKSSGYDRNAGRLIGVFVVGCIAHPAASAGTRCSEVGCGDATAGWNERSAVQRGQVDADEGSERVVSDVGACSDATLIDPAMHAAVDVDHLLSEAAGLRRIVDLAGEVGESERPTSEPRPGGLAT